MFCIPCYEDAKQFYTIECERPRLGSLRFRILQLGEVMDGGLSVLAMLDATTWFVTSENPDRSSSLDGPSC
jgi:hypothetical protein